MDRKHLVHGCRIAILVCIVVLIRVRHRQLMSLDSDAPAIVLGSVVRFFPDAHSVEVVGGGRVDVLDDRDKRLGYALQTAPLADHIIGFSGPTNVLVAFSPDDRILGLGVLSSRDTRDHLRVVTQDEAFMSSLNGLAADEVGDAHYDAVSGATLTSLAIRESVAFRLGNTVPRSLRFPEPPELEAVKTIFPNAVEFEEASNDGSYFSVQDSHGSEVGTVLRTSPAADNVVGYQGPSETLIGFEPSGRVVGVAVGKSFDNEPYVSYVRGDAYFRTLFNDFDLQRLAELDLVAEQVEGVSGATMTSQAVAEGLRAAANERLRALSQPDEASDSRLDRWSIHDYGTVACILVGAVIGLSRWKSHGFVVRIWQLTLVLYLGLVAGSLVSQAMLVGWAKNGIPTGSGMGLVLLVLAALLLPITSRRNIYCTHICPHGAAQQMLKNRFSWKPQLPRKLRAALRLLPGLLLLWCLLVAMSDLAYSLVDIEPFDAWVFRVAGWPTIIVAVVGLVASLFIPMAYCRFGCPTGALLEFLRFNARANQWSIRDWVAVSYLVLALALFWRKL